MLDPEWVGTVKRVYLRDEMHLEKDEKEEPLSHIRFSHLMVQRGWSGGTNVRVVRGRTTEQGKLGSYRGSEAPVFTNTLAAAKVVSEAKNLDDLEKLFGPQHDWTDSWGDGRRMYWSSGWTWFTTEDSNQLRYLSVFAMVSRAEAGRSTDIEFLDLREGIFRTANPTATDERLQFRTGEEVSAEWNAVRAKAREKYPLPLRSLVAASETPDDSDLIAYKRALNAVRKNPSAELFRQFAEWVDEGTCEIKGMLESVLFDDHLKLEKWQERQKTVALRALAEALPKVKTGSALDDVLVFLLQSQGGGILRLKVPGTDAVVDLKADRFPGTGASNSLGSQNITPENLALVARHCQMALREKYPDLE